MNNEDLARSLAKHEQACVEKHQEVLESIAVLRGEMGEMRVDMVWIKRALWFMLGWFAAMSIALISIV